MIGSLAASRSSKTKGWILIALVAGLIAVLFVVFDLGSQFKLRQGARDIASAASQRLLHRPAPRPPYPQVSSQGQDDQPVRQ